MSHDHPKSNSRLSPSHFTTAGVFLASRSNLFFSFSASNSFFASSNLFFSSSIFFSSDNIRRRAVRFSRAASRAAFCFALIFLFCGVPFSFCCNPPEATEATEDSEVVCTHCSDECTGSGTETSVAELSFANPEDI
ncbi:hypothetical protein DFS34DRAFT_274831 [Phlyctochytrium arcticum]|nr:hypothetical protein DFS34DRAFT_274831 [Phlyctochytrium arcticum]